MMNGVIDECVNTGFVHAGSETSYYPSLGGICGLLESSTITNCYNIGNVTQHVAGAAGIVSRILYEESSTIQNCYTIGACNGKAAFGNTTTAATNCYYNTETCTKSDEVATGLTTSQMKAASFVTTLGSSFVADIDNINNGYPILRWQRRGDT